MSLGENVEMSMENLTLKVAMLMTLSTAARGSDLRAIEIDGLLDKGIK